MAPEPKDNSHLWRDATEMEPELSEKEREIRDRFVDEFLVDRNPYSACLRIGYMSAFALEYSKRFMQESYVQKRIKEREFNIGIVGEESEEIKDENRKRIIASLNREAHYYGPNSSHAARVSALSKLAAIYGVDKLENPDDDEEGGVMLVPSHQDIDAWEKAAATSQQELQRDVRT